MKLVESLSRHQIQISCLIPLLFTPFAGLYHTSVTPLARCVLEQASDDREGQERDRLC
jgi:hypothetical protein